MKRALVIVICLSVLYAGVAGGFADCENFMAAAAAHDHGDHGEGHRHDDSAAPQQGDSGKIHCPNLFAPLLVGSRSSPESERRLIAAIDYPSVDLPFEVNRSTGPLLVRGPPGPKEFQSRPLSLLLSVIRI